MTKKKRKTTDAEGREIAEAKVAAERLRVLAEKAQAELDAKKAPRGS